MNVSTTDIRSNHSDYRDHHRDYREPRITHERLIAMKRFDDREVTRQKISLGTWIKEQINELLSCFDAAMFRKQNSCATRGHRVAVYKTRPSSSKCADCAASITSTTQMRSSGQHALRISMPVVQNTDETDFWVDQAALDRKIANRKKKLACWQQ